MFSTEIRIIDKNSCLKGKGCFIRYRKYRDDTTFNISREKKDILSVQFSFSPLIYLYISLSFTLISTKSNIPYWPVMIYVYFRSPILTFYSLILSQISINMCIVQSVNAETKKQILIYISSRA